MCNKYHKNVMTNKVVVRQQRTFESISNVVITELQLQMCSRCEVSLTINILILY